MDMFLCESVSCVCLCLSDEPVLFCIYVRKNVVLFTCLEGPREDKLWTLNKVFELNWIEYNSWINGSAVLISLSMAQISDISEIRKFVFMVEKVEKCW